MRESPTLYYATADVARRWHRDPSRIRQLARAGKLHPSIVTPSGQRLFEREEVERYEREHLAMESVQG